ncbi:hypothetical protein INT43_000965 [Umbelopsis isabellina]|uniref:Snurportin-1 n=1 Tax=Mortierella isabellina TaxID=91625 RepID=A0A8H7Q2R3_MORIS|nr:hypothetical protein INT43_000965 [Umbelopsis isabellina]
MPYVFKDPKQPVSAIKTPSAISNGDRDDSHNISSLLANTSLTPDQRQQSVHKLDKSPLGSRTKAESQEERRKKALQRQRQSRQNQVEYARRLAFERISASIQATNKDFNDEVDQDNSDVVDDDMGERNPSQKHQKRTKQRKQQDAYKFVLKDQVMFAEWLIDIPEDLYENWCLVCCPVGKRCLVVSANGQTTSRLRSGRTMNRFESILPAGSSTYRGNKVTDYCILDCIFDPVHWVYYVLDIMCWKGHPIYDCDTEFRWVHRFLFYWRSTKIQPEEMDTPTQNNQFYKFQPLLATSTTEMKNVLENPRAYMPPNTKANFDGYLLYSRQSQYVIGTTPLACWVSEDKAQELLANPLSIK